ncbi:hypothetical protein KY389_04550 [Paracoccus bogoriensis]|uniref:hypothetical protein n=1 Tax=Paracoccus bogoriensis TaxID=242065 RepID=UPI001CA4CF90|nr:hypothetical protein [Paracoccus bogoriensis]MBW7055965.1 hypothetical protein [Paracoccus bogoriensis]
MTEISASERRLSAALDRIDQLLEAGAARPRMGDDPRVGQLEAALAEAEIRLREAQDGAARLSAANDGLAAANRLLIEAAETGGVTRDEAIDALRAEIAALRAAREAEMAQMAEIMAELGRLLPADGDDMSNPDKES